MVEGEDEIYNAKVIFMGDPEVGKTSIIRTFMEGKPTLKTERTNMVSDFCRIIEVNVDGRRYRIKLNIWDAAGDGDVHNLAHLFLRDVQVAILVYGINSQKSFNDLDQWLTHLYESNEEGSFSLFLVGNKSDLSKQRAVPKIFGERKQQEIRECAMFKETSAYNDVGSILSLFDEIGKAIIRKNHVSRNRNSQQLRR